jgi:hypothetical protein
MLETNKNRSSSDEVEPVNARPGTSTLRGDDAIIRQSWKSYEAEIPRGTKDAPYDHCTG